MKPSRILLSFAIPALAAAAISCDDKLSQIGTSLEKGESVIRIDSIVYDLQGKTVSNDRYDSRTGNLLLGSLNVPEYGSLSCSFVTRMISASTLPIPDSISTDRIDSCFFRIRMLAGNLTGDSLAPQQVSVYKLTKQLPSGITNAFDPTGYYDPSNPMGRLNYTYSTVGKKLQVVSESNSTLWFPLNVPVSVETAKELVDKYRTDPSIFEWPQTFTQYFPGIYVEDSFGKGAVGNIGDVSLMVYYHELAERTVTEEDPENEGETISRKEQFHLAVPTMLMSVGPEVLSSNRITYSPSQNILDEIYAGRQVVTTPGGFVTRFTFPAESVIRDYKAQEDYISIISSLSLTIPATPIPNSFGIGPAPYLLMVKTSEIDSFFANNKIPDNKTSFYSTYDYTNNRYSFPSLRTYILSLMDKDTIEPEDVEFSLIPVLVTTETQENYYGQSTVYVVGCVPYTVIPTMTEVDTKNARIVFTFSSTLME